MSSDFSEDLTQGLEALNAILDDGDRLLVIERELALRAEIYEWSRANPGEARRIHLEYSTWGGYRLAWDAFGFRLGIFDRVPEEEFGLPYDFNHLFDELAEVSAPLAADPERLARIERDIRAIIASEFGVDQAEVSQREVGEDQRWVFRYRPNLADFAQDPHALDPPREPDAEPVHLDGELAQRANAFMARIPARPTEEQFEALLPDWLALRSDIARETGRAEIGLDIDHSGVTYRPVQRGDPFLLSRDLLAEITRLNERGPATSEPEWEHMRRRVAEVAGFPISQWQERENGRLRRVFVRSLVPANGEIQNGQTLRIPENGLVRVRNAIRQAGLERQREDLDNVIEDIAGIHRLPPGRVVIEPNRPIRCVYREPEAGQALRIPIELNRELERIRALPGPTERQNGIEDIQEYMARYYGLDRSDVEMVTSDSAEIAFQRRRLEVQAPPTGGGPPGTGGVTPPQPPPAVPIIAQPQGLGRKGHLKQGPVVPLTGSKSGPKILAIAEPGSDDSLSTGAIVGIVIGSITGLILVILVIFHIIKRRNQSKKSLNAPSA